MHGYHFRNFAKVIFLDLELEDKLKFRASSQTRTTRKIERAVKMEIVERNKLNGGMIVASFRSLGYWDKYSVCTKIYLEPFSYALMMEA